MVNSSQKIEDIRKKLNTVNFSTKPGDDIVEVAKAVSEMAKKTEKNVKTSFNGHEFEVNPGDTHKIALTNYVKSEIKDEKESFPDMIENIDLYNSCVDQAKYKKDTNSCDLFDVYVQEYASAIAETYPEEIKDMNLPEKVKLYTRMGFKNLDVSKKIAKQLPKTLDSFINGKQKIETSLSSYKWLNESSDLLYKMGFDKDKVAEIDKATDIMGLKVLLGLSDKSITCDLSDKSLAESIIGKHAKSKDQIVSALAQDASKNLEFQFDFVKPKSKEI